MRPDLVPRPIVRHALIGASTRDAARPAMELLSRVPWDGRKADPTRVSAARFLGTLPG